MRRAPPLSRWPAPARAEGLPDDTSLVTLRGARRPLPPAGEANPETESKNGHSPTHRAFSSRQRRPHHGRSFARGVHAGARHDDRQRVVADDRGQPRRERRPGDLGHHLVRGQQRDRAAADRLADAPFRRGAPVHGGDAAVLRRLVPLRHRAEHDDADPVPRDPGCGRGTDVSGHAEPAAVDLPARKTQPGARVADHGDDRRADRRADPRRLDHRQLFVAVDLLRQRAGRHLRRADRVRADARPRRADDAAEDGLRRPRHARDRRRRAADPARQGQRRGLVRVELHHRHVDHLGDQPHDLPDLGTDRQGTDRQPASCSATTTSPSARSR